MNNAEHKQKVAEYWSKDDVDQEDLRRFAEFDRRQSYSNVPEPKKKNGPNDINT